MVSSDEFLSADHPSILNFGEKSQHGKLQGNEMGIVWFLLGKELYFRGALLSWKYQISLPFVKTSENVK